MKRPMKKRRRGNESTPKSPSTKRKTLVMNQHQSTVLDLRPDVIKQIAAASNAGSFSQEYAIYSRFYRWLILQ